MGNLYIVATPIGNLQDITFRAVDVLKKVEYIACEDTRKTNFLLKSIGVTTKPFLISFYEQNEMARMPNILILLKNGKDVVLVSDSGTPTISDPGFKLIRDAIEQGTNVVSIPGPTAAISALVSSGLPTDKFLFLGFPPKKGGHRKTLYQKLKDSLGLVPSTVIIYESPFRVKKTLEELSEVFGDIKVVVARELTKVHENLLRGKISQIKDEIVEKGEFVILFNLKS